VAAHACTISSAAFRKRGTSRPMIAAGTMPNADNAE
jgi:hypothetical protein